MCHVNTYFVVNNIMFNIAMYIPRGQADVTPFTRPSLRLSRRD